MPRHQAGEFRRFLDMVEKNVLTDFGIHVVMDNASSHNTQMIRGRFAKRPRWHAHFAPASSSWINQVERFLGLLTGQQTRRGAHRSTKQCVTAITDCIEACADPKPLRWTKTANDVLASTARFCRRTLNA